MVTDVEVMQLVTAGKIQSYKLETVLQSPERGVAIRRELLSPKLPAASALEQLPFKDYDYSKVQEVRSDAASSSSPDWSVTLYLVCR